MRWRRSVLIEQARPTILDEGAERLSFIHRLGPQEQACEEPPLLLEELGENDQNSEGSKLAV
jgi:hypothetical protein